MNSIESSELSKLKENRENILWLKWLTNQHRKEFFFRFKNQKKKYGVRSTLSSDETQTKLGSKQVRLVISLTQQENSLNINYFIFVHFRLTNKAKTVVAVNQKCLTISVPPVSILHQLRKIHFTAINAGSAGKLEICIVLVQSKKLS